MSAGLVVDVKELKRRLPPLPAVWAALGGEEPRGGKVPCLWHEDGSPSLHLYADAAVCFAGCSSHDAIDIAQTLLGVDFAGAVAALAPLAGMAGRPRGEPARASHPSRPTPNRPKGRSQAALDVHRRIADVVLDQADLGSDEMVRWLEGRGIHPRSAWALGARSWSPHLPEIRSILNGSPRPALVEAGFLGEDGKPWFPLHRTPELPGLVFPSFAGGEVVEWRWRCPGPAWSTKAGEKPAPKAFAQPGGETPPVGLEVPPGELCLCPPGRARAIVVHEGETDLLSAVDVIEDVGLEDVAAIGIANMGAGWRPQWTSRIAGAELVIVAVHDDEQGQGRQLARELAAELLRVGSSAEASSCFFADKPNKLDANDLHKRGELGTWLAEALS